MLQLTRLTIRKSTYVDYLVQLKITPVEMEDLVLRLHEIQVLI